VDGGYAEYATARSDFVFPLPPDLDNLHAAPLLCAGIIGFRSLRIAGVEQGDRVGLFGFGASAHLAIAVLRAWKCEVYVSTRGATHRKLAESLGARWVGALRKGGVVAINAIHLDRMPEFDYDSLLWRERQIRSVANMTREDARDFLALAGKIDLKPQVTSFSLDQANEALQAVKNDAVNGAAVIVP
jgi:propanol-preferring alcohol dehydrogenase